MAEGANAGAMFVKLGMDNSEFISKMNHSIARVSGFNEAMSTAKGIIAGFTLYKLGSEIVKFGEDAFRTATQFQGFERQLRAITGSNTVAAESMRALSNMAATVPVPIDRIIETFINMKAVGMNATESVIKTLAGVAFVFNKDISTVENSLVMMRQRTLRQLGIELVRTGDQAIIMSNGMEIAVANTSEAIRAGIIEMWQKRFPDALEEARNSWTGLTTLMSNKVHEIKETLGNTLIPVMKTIVSEGINPVIDKIKEWVNENKAAVRDMVSTQFVNLVEGLKLVAEAMGLLISLVYDFKAGLAGVRTLFSWYFEYMEKFRGIVTGSEEAKKNAEIWDSIAKNNQKQMEFAKGRVEGVNKALHMIEGTLTGIGKAGQKATESLFPMTSFEEESRAGVARLIGGGSSGKEGVQTAAMISKITEATKKMWDEIHKASMGEFDYELSKIKEQADEWQKLGLKRVDIEKWVQTQTDALRSKKRISEWEAAMGQFAGPAMEPTTTASFNKRIIAQMGGVTEVINKNNASILDGLREMWTKLVDVKNVASDLATTFITNIGQGIADVIVSGENFGNMMVDVFKKILEQVIALVAEMVILQAIMEAMSGGTLGGFWFGLTGMFGFHKGGLVGGIPIAHSGMLVGGDNMPIIAQRGEGILSRDRGMPAVGGPSGLAALNSGIKQGGDVYVTFQGNVYQDDRWIEDTVIPKIRDAARRNVGFQSTFSR